MSPPDPTSGPPESEGPGGSWHYLPPDRDLPTWAAVWAPVIVSFVVQFAFATWQVRWGPAGPRESLALLVLAVSGPIALIGARRFPGPVVLIVAVIASVDLWLTSYGGPPYLALMFAIVGAIVRGARAWAWAAVGGCWILTIVVGIALGRDGPSPARIAATGIAILVVFGIGEGIRGRRERYAEYRRLARQREQSEVQAERARIARELHDVLAHSLSQINVQAGVGLHLMDRQPDKAAEALASIKDTSKTALEEVRTVIGALRTHGPGDAPLVPEPGLDRLAALVDGIRGIEVSLDDRIREAPKPIELALYRIVQESLTNVTRHAAATHAWVRLWSTDLEYRVEVRDDGSGPTGTASETGGRGLLGMRERAELLGGHLSAGPAEGGGFLVSATIPKELR